MSPYLKLSSIWMYNLAVAYSEAILAFNPMVLLGFFV